MTKIMNKTGIKRPETALTPAAGATADKKEKAKGR